MRRLGSASDRASQLSDRALHPRLGIDEFIAEQEIKNREPTYRRKFARSRPLVAWDARRRGAISLTAQCWYQSWKQRRDSRSDDATTPRGKLARRAD